MGRSLIAVLCATTLAGSCVPAPVSPSASSAASSRPAGREPAQPAEVSPAPVTSNAPVEDGPLPELGPALVPAELAALSSIEGIELVADGRALLVDVGSSIALLDTRDGRIRSVLPEAEMSIAYRTRVLTTKGIWDWARDRIVVVSQYARHTAATSDARFVARVHQRQGDDERLVLIDMAAGTERELASVHATSSLRMLSGDTRLLVVTRGELLLLSIPEGEVIARFEGNAARGVPPDRIAVLERQHVVVRRLADGAIEWRRALPPELVDPTARLEPIASGRVVVTAHGQGRYELDAATGAPLPAESDPTPASAPEVVDEIGDARLALTEDCALVRRDPNGEGDVRLAPPPDEPAEDEDGEDDEEYDEEEGHEEAWCEVRRSADGAVLAFARREGVYLFDGRSLAARYAPPADAVRPSYCLLSPGSDSTAALGLWEADDGTVTLAGCGELRLFEIGGREGRTTLATSANGRYTLVATAAPPREDEEDEDDPSIVPTTLSLERRGARPVPLGERMTCYEDSGRDETEMWVFYLVCTSAAAVRDDGREVFFVDDQTLVMADVRARRARRVPLSHPVSSIELLGPRFVWASGARHTVIDVASGERHTGATISIDEARQRVLLTAASELTVLELASGETRTFASEEGEEWTLSRDGSALIRLEPSAPLVRIAITSGARRSTEPPPTAPVTRASVSADAQRILACVDGALHVHELDTDASPRRVEGAPCGPDVRPSFLAGDRVVALRGASHDGLVRLRDAATLTLRPTGLHEGANAAWTTDGRFFVPPALVPRLVVREAGPLFDAALVPAASSPRYAPELVRDLLAPPSD